jgi:hypothetical protein
MRVALGGFAGYRSAALLALTTLCALLLGAAPAWGSLPIPDGSSFPTLHGPSDPEEFSWEVTLGEDQELRQVDEHEVAVYYIDDEVRAFSIQATAAHDSVGSDVPTSIQVTGDSEVTLTVHHRAGNPAAGGAPFVYPINPGVGWEGGFSTVTIQMPPGEPPEPERTPNSPPRCRVPSLRGATLAGARRQLRRAHCRLGAVRRPSDVSARQARVAGQGVKPGSSLPRWSKVGVTLRSR